MMEIEKIVMIIETGKKSHHKPKHRTPGALFFKK